MSDESPTKHEDGPPVLDLAHLGRQTVGDVALQREVLRLFEEHAARVVAEIKAADSHVARREAAHALVGSARGIGAFAVAGAAGAIEAGTADSAAGFAALEAAVAAVQRAISEHLSD